MTARSDANRFLFDATRAGVLGRKLSEAERFALIEYLKIIDCNPPQPCAAVGLDWEWSPHGKN